MQTLRVAGVFAEFSPELKQQLHRIVQGFISVFFNKSRSSLNPLSHALHVQVTGQFVKLANVYSDGFLQEGGGHDGAKT